MKLGKVQFFNKLGRLILWDDVAIEIQILLDYRERVDAVLMVFNSDWTEV